MSTRPNADIIISYDGPDTPEPVEYTIEWRVVKAFGRPTLVVHTFQAESRWFGLRKRRRIGYRDELIDQNRVLREGEGYLQMRATELARRSVRRYRSLTAYEGKKGTVTTTGI